MPKENECIGNNTRNIAHFAIRHNAHRKAHILKGLRAGFPTARYRNKKAYLKAPQTAVAWSALTVLVNDHS